MFFDDDSSDSDDSNNLAEWRRILWGLFGAGFAAYVAHECFITGEGSYSIRHPFEPRQYFTIRGAGAVAQGVEFSFIAAFLHFHYFWAYFPSLQPLRWLVTRISIVGFVIATVYFVIYIAQHPEQTGNA